MLKEAFEENVDAVQADDQETTHLHALACKCDLGRQRAELA